MPSARDRTDEDRLAPYRGWVWLLALALLLGLLGFWLARVVPEEYEKLRARSSDDRHALRAEGVAAALAQYRRHVGAYPDRLGDLVAPTGPPGYRGPYLPEVPLNPSTDGPDWAFDTTTGEVRDPTGNWAGSAVAPSLIFSDLSLDWGRLDLPEGRDLVTGDFVSYRAPRGRPVLVHFFSDDDAALGASLERLEALSREGSAVVAVLVRAPRTSGDAARILDGLSPSFPVLDSAADGERVLRAHGFSDTPVTILADDELNRRARLHGPVTQESLERAVDQVWDVYEVASLGRERRPEGAPDIEPEPTPPP